MRWALNGSMAMNGREREGWEGVEGLQEGSKGLSYTDEWALASNHRVPSLSNESEDATRKESTCKLIFTKRKGYQTPIYTSNKNFILKYFRCRDGKRTETRIGMEGICITHSCIPLYTVYMQHIMAHTGGMQEWVIQIPSIPILFSVLFPSLHLKYFRIKFLLLVCIVFMRMRTKPHPHPVIS